MNIDEPHTSRRIAKLMNSLRLSLDDQYEFIKQAGMAKDMDSFIEDINNKKFFKV
tara:strand:+ start:188 stop:352 length:165 start_codon:yes stop_codon:yes gene_type:complete